MNHHADCLNLPINKWHDIELDRRLKAITAEAGRIRAEMARREAKGSTLGMPKASDARKPRVPTDC